MSRTYTEAILPPKKEGKMRRILVLALAVMVASTVWAFPRGGHHRRNLFREYCETNKKSEACKKIIKLMEQMREARRELISEMKGYCDANPKEDFCQRLHRMHMRNR